MPPERSLGADARRRPSRLQECAICECLNLGGQSIQNIAVAFWGKLRVAFVAKSSISEGLPNAEFPLLPKNQAVFLRVCLP